MRRRPRQGVGRPLTAVVRLRPDPNRKAEADRGLSLVLGRSRDRRLDRGRIRVRTRRRAAGLSREALAEALPFHVAEVRPVSSTSDVSLGLTGVTVIKIEVMVTTTGIARGGGPALVHVLVLAPAAAGRDQVRGAVAVEEHRFVGENLPDGRRLDRFSSFFLFSFALIPSPPSFLSRRETSFRLYAISLMLIHLHKRPVSTNGFFFF